MSLERFSELLNSCFWGAWTVLILAWCLALLSKSIPEKTSATNQRLQRWQANNARLSESNARIEKTNAELNEALALMKKKHYANATKQCTIKRVR